MKQALLHVLLGEGVTKRELNSFTGCKFIVNSESRIVVCHLRYNCIL